MNRVFIAFGSNIGDRGKAIASSMNLVEQRGMKIIKKSNVYETEPYGYKDQPSFMNGVLEVETNLTCREVLRVLLKIEEELGRVRELRWGPRTIDLDIVFFNNEIYNEEDLKVPHPDMQNRKFVLEPLCEIAPDYIHPTLGKSIRELYTELRRNS